MLVGRPTLRIGWFAMYSRYQTLLVLHPKYFAVDSSVPHFSYASMIRLVSISFSLLFFIIWSIWFNFRKS